MKPYRKHWPDGVNLEPESVAILNNGLEWGIYKTWTLDSRLDLALDSQLFRL